MIKNFAFDKDITIAANHFARRHPLVFEGVRIIGVGAIFIPVTFGAIGLMAEFPFIKTTEETLFVHMLLAGVSAWIINNALGSIFVRKRPYKQFPKEITRIISLKFFSKSFPSDHTAIAFALATTICLWSTISISILFFLIAMLIGLTRMAAGLHFLTDIVTGAFLGVFVAILVHGFLVV